MDPLLVLAPIVVSVVIALSRSETTRWLLYLVYCWWLVRKYGPEALNMRQSWPERFRPDLRTNHRENWAGNRRRSPINA